MSEKHNSSRVSQREEGRLDSPVRTLDLCELGIDQEQAADLRWRLRTFAEDWQRQEMDVYDA
ncbi:MAG: hypothetical protein WCJ35_25970 [Planctomycetota bacterium]